MPEKKPSLDGVILTNEQAALFDRCAEKVKGAKDVGSVCAESFRRTHKIVGTGKNRRWVEKEKKKK